MPAPNEQAEKLAEQVGIAAPTEPTVSQKALYDQTSRFSGTAFDRAFVREMIAEHKMNIPSSKMRQRRRTIR